MGKLLPSYRKALYDEMLNNISSNVSHYYVFAGISNEEKTTNDDYTTLFTSTWKMLFGKKLANSNIVPIIKNNLWASNTVYDRYDNTDTGLHDRENFFVLAPPSIVGGDYNIYKCIDNANGAPSLVKPYLTQSTTFETPDGYKWRYIASVTYPKYQTIATPEYSPLYTNSSIIASAKVNAGVEVVVVANAGTGYITYHDGNILSKANSTLLQVANTASPDSNFYNNCSIYIYNNGVAASDLIGITSYVANSSGNWVYLESSANLANINPPFTNYKISPKVVFNVDGNSSPAAYSVVNTFSNSIYKVVVLEKGSDITRANVHLECNTAYGSGANLYAIVPPLGGHGSDPASEFNMKGVSISFSFSNTENDTIFANDITYDVIGMVKNPYAANTANVLNITKGSRYWANTFSQVLVANVGFPFSIGEQVEGANSGAIGEVIYSDAYNDTYEVWMVGDKSFHEAESIIAANGATTTLFIRDYPSLYGKDLKPIYVQNINTIERKDDQTESFNLLIQF